MIESDIHAHMSRAYFLAKDSPDRSTQNGATLISAKGYLIGNGRNEFPPKTKWTMEQLLDRDWKLANIEHAERNTIFAALRQKHDLDGSTMICPFAACTDCARAIVLVGVKELIVHKELMEKTPERWKKSVDAGLKILEDHHISIQYYSGHFPDSCPILFDGKLWQP